MRSILLLTFLATAVHDVLGTDCVCSFHNYREMWPCQAKNMMFEGQLDGGYGSYQCVPRALDVVTKPGWVAGIYNDKVVYIEDDAQVRLMSCAEPRSQATLTSDLACPPQLRPGTTLNTDGKWSTWSTWSTCPVTCGGGSQQRTRACVYDPTKTRGNACVGLARETATCASTLCPVDGKFTAWSAWSACSATCGGGKQRRTRACQYDNTKPRGNPCVGAVDETQNCGQSLCPTTPAPTQAPTTFVPISAIPHSTKCDFPKLVQHLAQKTPASHSKALTCPDGSKTSPEALLFETCHSIVNYNFMTWKQERRVVDHCRNLPQGEPIAFYVGPRPILLAIFWQCLPTGGFEIAYQACGRPLQTVDLSKTPVFPMDGFYTVTW